MLTDAAVPASTLGPPFASADAAELRLDIGVGPDGRIALLRPAGGAGLPDWRRLALEGRQVWPGLVEIHAHIDKAATGERSPNPQGTSRGARDAAKRDREHWTEEELLARMNAALAWAEGHGTVALRTHLDSQADRAQPAWSLWPGLREAWAGRLELQAVADLGAAKLMGPYGDRLADLVARQGGVLGPVVYPSPGMDAQIARAFDLAEARGLDLDFHVDETADPAARGLRRIAETALERGFRGRIVCGHASSLSLQPEEEAEATIALVSQAGIGVVALPGANLYLQGRAAGRTPTWRGVTRVLELRAAGVPVAFAGDNVQDGFYPFGEQDLVDVLRDAVRVAHLDHPFARWVEAISATPARMMGLKDAGTIAQGRPADLVIFGQSSAARVLATLGRERIVVRAGRALPPGA